MGARVTMITIAAASITAWGATASAYTIGTTLTDGCHESMTLRALSLAGWPAESGSPPTLTEAQQIVVASAPFHVPATVTDPWTFGLLLGVRYNDIHDRRPSDLPAVVQLAADPTQQREHCLRTNLHEGPIGTEHAVSDCLDFISGEIAAAVGSSDTIDMSAEETVSLWLDFSGTSDVSVNRYAFHVGRALHALQDGFSHLFRSDDGHTVLHAVNYIDLVNGDLQEPIDGHPHIPQLDDCMNTPSWQQPRIDWTVTASSQLLSALQSPEGGRDGRLAGVKTVLDDWFAVEPGCTFENGWCHAKEPTLAQGSGCDVVPRRLGSRTSAVFAALALGMVALRRRRRHAVAITAVLAGLLAFFAVAPVAHAQDTAVPAAASSRSSADATLNAASPGVANAAAPENGAACPPPVQPIERGFGVYVGTGVAIDEGALMGALGARLDIGRRFTVGITGEINPWLSIDTGAIRAGTFNLYATGIYRYAIGHNIELRATLHAGASVLLFNLQGADAGSIGPFVGVSLLGIAVRLNEHLRLIVDPAEIVVAVPQMTGVPLAYREHRFVLGVQWNP